MIPLASGEADDQNIQTSQNVSICLTLVCVWLNSGLVSSLLVIYEKPPNGVAKNNDQLKRKPARSPRAAAPANLALLEFVDSL